jgi:toxin ParE1/3/4
VYIGEHANPDVADNFLTSAERSFRDLAAMPEMGSPARVRRGKFKGVRLWPIARFEKYLIVYRPVTDGVQIERVIHSAQDYHRILR